MRKGARVVVTELIRAPVKEAVRDALHEETASVTSTSGDTNESNERQRSERRSSGRQSGESSSKTDQKSGQGGRSKLAMVGVVLAIAGVAFLARRRMSSTSGSAWSEPSPAAVAEDDAEGGYVSEGEMQTAEAGGEQDTDANEPGTSASTTSDQ